MQPFSAVCQWQCVPHFLVLCILSHSYNFKSFRSLHLIFFISLFNSRSSLTLVSVLCPLPSIGFKKLSMLDWHKSESVLRQRLWCSAGLSLLFSQLALSAFLRLTCAPGRRSHSFLFLCFCCFAAGVLFYSVFGLDPGMVWSDFFLCRATRAGSCITSFQKRTVICLHNLHIFFKPAKSNFSFIWKIIPLFLLWHISLCSLLVQSVFMMCYFPSWSTDF